MPKTFVPQSLIQSLVLALLFATLAACGGGGGGGGVGSKQPTPTPTPTPAPDTSPNDFSFEAVTGAQRGEVYTASVTVSGINTATPVSIEGGLFAIGEAELVEEGEVTNGQSITVQVTASDQFSTESTATLTVGDKSADFTVTTEARDLEPVPFTFDGQTDAELDTAYISNPITVSGINDATPISIEGGEFEIDGSGDEFTPVVDANTTVNAGQTVRVRVTSANAVSQTTQATLTIGNQTGTFSVTTFADTQAPVAEIAFPPPVSMTAHTALTVRGTVADDYSDVAQVTVLINGADSGVLITPVEDEANPGVFNWSAQITLTEDEDHTVIVTTRDSEGNINSEAASVTVTQGSLDNAFPDLENSIGNVVATTVDLRGEQRKLITASYWTNEFPSSITIIDLDTSTVLEQVPITGLQIGYESVASVTLDELTNDLYVSTIGIDGYGVAKIDLDTGSAGDNMITFARITGGTPGRVLIDRSGNDSRLLFALHDYDAVYEMDLELENFHEFSGPTIPSDETDYFEQPSDMIFCECSDGDQLYVIDGVEAAIFKVDPIAGEREVFSAEGVNGDTGFNSLNAKRSITLDSIGRRLLIAGADTNQIIEVSLEDGERDTFSNDSTMSSVLGFTDIIAHPELGYALVVEGEGLNAVFAVDLESGERVIISKGRETNLH